MSPERRAGAESAGEQVLIRRLIAEMKLAQPALGLVFFSRLPGVGARASRQPRAIWRNTFGVGETLSSHAGPFWGKSMDRGRTIPTVMPLFMKALRGGIG